MSKQYDKIRQIVIECEHTMKSVFPRLNVWLWIKACFTVVLERTCGFKGVIFGRGSCLQSSKYSIIIHGLMLLLSFLESSCILNLGLKVHSMSGISIRSEYKSINLLNDCCVFHATLLKASFYLKKGTVPSCAGCFKYHCQPIYVV